MKRNSPAVALSTLLPTHTNRNDSSCHFSATPLGLLLGLLLCRCAFSNMAPSLSRLSSTGRISIWLLLISCLSCIHVTLAVSPKYIQATTEEGKTVYLLDERKPALYTQNFGDCLGDSLINVTRFDAAYYKDNMTVLFHLKGTQRWQMKA